MLGGQPSNRRPLQMNHLPGSNSPGIRAAPLTRLCRRFFLLESGACWLLVVSLMASDFSHRVSAQVPINFAKTADCGRQLTSRGAVPPVSGGAPPASAPASQPSDSDNQPPSETNDAPPPAPAAPTQANETAPGGAGNATTREEATPDLDVESYLLAQSQNHGTDVDLYIVGGSDAYRGEFPFIVSLVYSGRHFCGGSMIHEQFALTAAHCYISQYFGSPDSPRNLAVRIREYIRSTLAEGEPRQQDIKVVKAIPHAEWTASLFKGSKNDIALLKLETPVVWDNFVQPVCLTPQGLNTDAATATVIGWGTTTFGGSPSDVLQKVDVPVMSNGMCRFMYTFNLLFYPVIDSSHVCAGAWQGGVDSCQGDSGGPLFVKLQDKFALLGIVSEGFGCAKFFNPGKYTRIGYYLQWIKDRIGENGGL